MKPKKSIILLAAILLCTSIFAAFYVSSHVFVNGKAFSKSAELLDLRGTGISVGEYESLTASLPSCNILWDIPFQCSFYPMDTETLAITSLTLEDVQSIPYFRQLKAVNAAGCRDYDALMILKDSHPNLSLSYTVPIDGKEWPQDTTDLEVSSLSEGDVAMLAHLPELTNLEAGTCSALNLLAKIQELYPHIGLSYQLSLCGETFDRFSQELSLTQADVAEVLTILPHMPNLESLELISPVGDAEDLLTLVDSYPNVSVTWSREVLGIPVTSTDMEVDLSGTTPESLEQIRQEMAWFPAVEKLILCDLEFDNETMAAFREEVRSEYKVVWNVDVGYLTMRTDEIYYMPGKYNLGVTEEQAYNLRYFEDMICIDVGHKPLFTCEWAAFMPNLKYLIIADTMIDDISPLEGHDQLIYLEMFITKVTDLTPLLSCTALQDLNLCYTHADPEPITQMTWLKNLWWAEPPIEEEEFQQYLPNTHLMFLHHSSTGNGWRQLQNYYDMRDILGMHYMWG